MSYSFRHINITSWTHNNIQWRSDSNTHSTAVHMGCPGDLPDATSGQLDLIIADCSDKCSNAWLCPNGAVHILIPGFHNRSSDSLNGAVRYMDRMSFCLNYGGPLTGMYLLVSWENSLKSMLFRISHLIFDKYTHSSLFSLSDFASHI